MTTVSNSTGQRAIRINAADNVATVLDDVEAGAMVIQGPLVPLEIQALEPIRQGHKIALDDLEPGAQILKFGVPIAVATLPILRGQWVHLHNCRSRVDERSAGLDPKTGATKDTPYA